MRPEKKARRAYDKELYEIAEWAWCEMSRTFHTTWLPWRACEEWLRDLGPEETLSRIEEMARNLLTNIRESRAEQRDLNLRYGRRRQAKRSKTR
jgi:hypothetical protein